MPSESLADEWNRITRSVHNGVTAISGDEGRWITKHRDRIARALRMLEAAENPTHDILTACDYSRARAIVEAIDAKTAAVKGATK